MDTLEIIINGIVELSTMNVLEGLSEDVITIKGSKKGLFNSKEIELQIRKSDDEVAALVDLIKNGNKHSLEIHKNILYDILQRTHLLDQKLKMKLDILFNDRKLVFKDGKLIIE